MGVRSYQLNEGRWLRFENEIFEKNGRNFSQKNLQ